MYDVELVEALPILKKLLKKMERNNELVIPSNLTEFMELLDGKRYVDVFTSLNPKIVNAILIFGGKPEYNLEYVEIYNREKNYRNLQGFDHCYTLKCASHESDEFILSNYIPISKVKKAPKKTKKPDDSDNDFDNDSGYETPKKGEKPNPRAPIKKKVKDSDSDSDDTPIEKPSKRVGKNPTKQKGSFSESESESESEDTPKKKIRVSDSDSEDTPKKKPSKKVGKNPTKQKGSFSDDESESDSDDTPKKKIRVSDSDSEDTPKKKIRVSDSDSEDTPKKKIIVPDNTPKKKPKKKIRESDSDSDDDSDSTPKKRPHSPGSYSGSDTDTDTDTDTDSIESEKLVLDQDEELDDNFNINDYLFTNKKLKNVEAEDNFFELTADNIKRQLDIKVNDLPVDKNDEKEEKFYFHAFHQQLSRDFKKVKVDRTFWKYVDEDLIPRYAEDKPIKLSSREIVSIVKNTLPLKSYAINSNGKNTIDIMLDDNGTPFVDKPLAIFRRFLNTKYIKNYIMAGGSAFGTLTGNKFSDYDMFFFSCTKKHSKMIIDDFIKRADRFITEVYYNENVITVHLYFITINGNSCREIVQFILRVYNSPSEVIHGFDTDNSCILYDFVTNSYWFTERFMYSLKYGVNTVNFERLSPSYEYRLIKGLIRSVSIDIPLFERYYKEIQLGNISKENGLSIIIRECMIDYKYTNPDKFNNSRVNPYDYGGYEIGKYRGQKIDFKIANPSEQSIGTFHRTILDNVELWYKQSSKLVLKEIAAKQKYIKVETVAEQSPVDKLVIKNLPINGIILGQRAANMMNGTRYHGVVYVAFTNVEDAFERFLLFTTYITRYVYDMIIDNGILEYGKFYEAVGRPFEINFSELVPKINDFMSMSNEDLITPDLVLEYQEVGLLRTENEKTVLLDALRKEVSLERLEIIKRYLKLIKLYNFIESFSRRVPKFLLVSRNFPSVKNALKDFSISKNIYDFEKVAAYKTEDGSLRFLFSNQFEDNIQDNTHTSSAVDTTSKVMDHKILFKDESQMKKDILDFNK